MQGSNANVSHTINEDERREFTNHINGVSTTRFLVFGMHLFDDGADFRRYLKVMQMSVHAFRFPPRRCSSLTRPATV